MKSPITVLLVDDHPVVRKGVRFCLVQEERIKVVGEASDGVEGLRLAKELKPDIVVTDVEMPQMDGLEFVTALRRALPATAVLAFSVHADAEHIQHIIESGAHGYILKQADPEQLVQAIDALHRGEVFLSPQAARVVLGQLVGVQSGLASDLGLTPREREVLVGIAEGHSNREIARRLGVGVRTIETHRAHLMKKLDIHTVAGLTKFAMARGIVPPHPDE